MAQNRQISRPKSKDQGSQNAEFEKRRTRRDRAHHGMPVENTTDRGGGTHGRTLDTHGRAPLLLGFSSFFRATFRLPAVFPATLPYISDAPGHYKTPITTP